MIPNFARNTIGEVGWGWWGWDGRARERARWPERRFRLYRATVTTSQPEEQVRVQPARGTRSRGTRQAQALAAALESLPGFCSAQEIHAELRRKGEHVGLTTVYRHLQVLSEQGSVDTIRDASGETLYRQCGTSVHHHHLTCRNCGRSMEVEGRAVERWAEKVAAEAGFTDVGHTVELFGLCPQCAP
jgi:Fur family ferric uptake transcriptional regulator